MFNFMETELVNELQDCIARENRKRTVHLAGGVTQYVVHVTARPIKDLTRVAIKLPESASAR